jgi:drug/metabolite transporter (DMT)-like permease
MDWLAASLGSAAVFAIVTVLDKRLLQSHFPSAASLNFSVGVTQLFIGFLALAVALPVEGMPAIGGSGLAVIAGLLWSASLVLFFHGLRLEEVSRATPIYFSSPVFTAFLAVGFLGEQLSGPQWVAILMVVVGVMLVSYRPSSGRRGLISRKALLFLVSASMMTAIALVVNKESLETTSLWSVYGLRAAGMGVGMILLSFQARVLREVRDVASRPRSLGLFTLTEVLLAPVAVVLLMVALFLGPVSLVATVSSVRPLLVLGISVILSTRLWNVLDEPLDRDTLVLKGISILVIAGGVSMLSLF